jgi:hypothetical protein
MGGLEQLFCFLRKTVEFPIHFCLVYLSLILTIAVGNKTDLVVFTKRLADVFDTDGVSTSVVDCELLLLLLMIRSGRGNACYARAKSYDE